MAEGEAAKPTTPPKPAPPNASAAKKAAAGVSLPPAPPIAVKSKAKQSAITAFTESSHSAAPTATASVPQKRKSDDAEKEENEMVGAGNLECHDSDFAPSPPSKVSKQQKLDSVVVSKPKENIVTTIEADEEIIGRGDEDSVIFNIVNDDEEEAGEEKENGSAKTKAKPKETVSPVKGSKKKQKLVDDEDESQVSSAPKKSLAEPKSAKPKAKVA